LNDFQIFWGFARKAAMGHGFEDVKFYRDVRP
jgi:hypothetical protein